MSTNSDFSQKVCELIALVPTGSVTTYGDLAGLAGHANASRIVGGIAHFGPSDLPWHRLVNRFGGLASGFHEGREVQETLLKTENVKCTNFIVDDFESHRWKPNL